MSSKWDGFLFTTVPYITSVRQLQVLSNDTAYSSQTQREIFKEGLRVCDLKMTPSRVDVSMKKHHYDAGLRESLYSPTGSVPFQLQGIASMTHIKPKRAAWTETTVLTTICSFWVSSPNSINCTQTVKQIWIGKFTANVFAYSMCILSRARLYSTRQVTLSVDHVSNNRSV